MSYSRQSNGGCYNVFELFVDESHHKNMIKKRLFIVLLDNLQLNGWYIAYDLWKGKYFHTL